MDHFGLRLHTKKSTIEATGIEEKKTLIVNSITDIFYGFVDPHVKPANSTFKVQLNLHKSKNRAG